ESFGERPDRAAYLRPSVTPAQISRWRPRRLHSDHPNGRPELLCDDARTRRSAAAADRNDERIDVRALLEHFESSRSDTGDQIELVPGVDVAHARHGGAPLALFPRLVVVDAVFDDRRAVVAHRVELQRVRADRGDDRHGNAEG